MYLLKNNCAILTLFFMLKLHLVGGGGRGGGVNIFFNRFAFLCHIVILQCFHCSTCSSVFVDIQDHQSDVPVG